MIEYSAMNLISSTSTFNVYRVLIILNIRKRGFNVSLILFAMSASLFWRVDEAMMPLDEIGFNNPFHKNKK
ncbi:hypothetical protein ACTFIU_003750 [Dictyostelium citrinum]